MTRFNRRQALSALLAIPFAGATVRTAGRQAPASARHRVVATQGHGLLIEPDGTVQIWHTAHQTDRLDALLGLGPASALPPYTLRRVPGLSDVVTAAVGPSCSFVITANGTLRTWGVNGGNGRLGTTPLSVVETGASSGPDANVPVSLAVRFDAVDVSTMNNHVLALTRDGRVYAWGTGDKGQLGIGPLPVVKFRTRSPSALPYVPYPVEIPGLANVKAISAGYTHSLVLMNDGTVRAWGENRWGEVGDGTTVMRNAPVAVPDVRNAVAVAAGGGFSAALLGDGTVMTWGNRFATPDGRAEPTAMLVPGVTGVRAIAAGGSHVLALTAAGTIVSWGQPDFGALGRGDATVWTPGPIPGLTGVQSVFAQGGISMAVLASGRIMTWGEVRPWTRPPEEGPWDNLSRRPILLWIDGLDQP